MKSKRGRIEKTVKTRKIEIGSFEDARDDGYCIGYSSKTDKV